MVVKYMHHRDDLVEHRTCEASFVAQCTNHSANSMCSLPVNTKHPVILPSRHPLTRLIVLNAHERAGHGGPKYTFTKTLENFWIIHGNSSVKHYIADCVKCAILKAKSIRQLMADLPACRVAVCNKPFKFSGIDYLGPYLFRQNRSECKAWGLLFTCLCTRCLHVELVTSWTAFFSLSAALLMFVELSTLYFRIMLLLFVQPQINYLTYWGPRNFVTLCVSLILMG